MSEERNELNLVAGSKSARRFSIKDIELAMGIVCIDDDNSDNLIESLLEIEAKRKRKKS